MPVGPAGPRLRFDGVLWPAGWTADQIFDEWSRRKNTASVTPTPRDYAWAASELGDVPFDRVIGASAHDNPTVWVESLGRDQ